MATLIGALIGTYLIHSMFSWAAERKKLKPLLMKFPRFYIVFPGLSTLALSVAVGSLNFGFGEALLLYFPTTMCWLIIRSLKFNRDGTLTAAAVESLVKGRIKQAERSGSPELVLKMLSAYGRYTPQMPAFITGSSSEKIPSRNGCGHRLSFRAGDETLVLELVGTFTEDSKDFADISVIWNEQVVMSLGATDVSFAEFPNWKHFAVKSFLPGKWQNLLVQIQSGIEQVSRERSAKERENPEKLEDLKKKFGL